MAKCRHCKEEIVKEDGKYYQIKQNQYYCDEYCFEKSKNKSDTSYAARLPLTDYIQRLYLENGYNKSEINWQMICSQIANMMEKNKDYTYKGIGSTLYYMVTILEIDVFDCPTGSILNLVPINYKPTMDFGRQIKGIRKEVEDFDMNYETQKIETNKKHKVSRLEFDNMED